MTEHPEHVTDDGMQCWCHPHVEPVYVNEADPDDGRVAGFVVIHNDDVGIALGTRPQHYQFEGKDGRDTWKRIHAN